MPPTSSHSAGCRPCQVLDASATTQSSADAVRKETIGEKAVVELPLNGRNYLELEETNGLPRTAMPELPVPRLYSVPEAERALAGTDPAAPPEERVLQALRAA